MTGDLVPLQRIRFGGGRRWRDPEVVLAVEPLPRSTMDYRYRFCLQHHTACDCREAELAEQIGEYKHEIDQVRAAVLHMLVGHRLFDYGDDVDPPADRATRMKLVRGDGPLACQCTGCRLVRAADLSGIALRTDDHGVVMTAVEYEDWLAEIRSMDAYASDPHRARDAQGNLL